MLGQSYNGWLRAQNHLSRDTLLKTMVKLQVLLQELPSLSESETTTVHSQVLRINTAMVHLETELLLLATIREVQ